MKIRDVMTASVHTIRADEDLEVARQLMLWCGFRHLPVVDGEKLVGILTERDVLARKAALREAELAHHDSRRQTVGGAMQVPVETTGPDDDAFVTAARMASRRIGCMPVVEGEKLVGIVTTTDLLGAFGVQGMVSAPARGVSSVMTEEPLRLRPNATVGHAVALMVTEGVRHLPVVDDEGHVVGIVSDRDIRSAVGDPLGKESNRRARLQMLVAGIMTTPPATVSDSSTLSDAVEVLIDRKIGALPVVDEHERLVGMLSYVDVLRSTKGLSS